jgi:hypothetical protein
MGHCIMDYLPYRKLTMTPTSIGFFCATGALSPQLRDRQAAPSPVFKFDLLDGHESRVKGLVQDLKQKLTDALDKSAFLFGGHGVIF